MKLKSTLFILLVADIGFTCNAAEADTGQSMEETVLTINSVDMAKADTSVVLSNFDYAENEYSDGTNVWSALKLHKAADGLQAFDVPLASINLSSKPWGDDMNLNSMLHHYKRIQEADLNYPIIYDDEGILADGWHRVCKAVMEKHQTIKAVRLTKMPEPDRAEQLE